MADPLHNVRHRTVLRLGGFLGFVGGFLMAYQNSSGTHHTRTSAIVLTSIGSPLLGMG